MKLSKIPKANVPHLFKLWKKENFNEALTITNKGWLDYGWYFVLVDDQIIGFVALIEENINRGLIPVSLEMLYIFPKFRKQGYSKQIRDKLIVEKNLQALTIGKYDDNIEKYKKHKKIAEQSGFIKHYAIILRFGSCVAELASEVFVHSNNDPKKLYSFPFYAIEFDEFIKVKQHAEQYYDNIYF